MSHAEELIKALETGDFNNVKVEKFPEDELEEYGVLVEKNSVLEETGFLNMAKNNGKKIFNPEHWQDVA